MFIDLYAKGMIEWHWGLLVPLCSFADSSKYKILSFDSNYIRKAKSSIAKWVSISPDSLRMNICLFSGKKVGSPPYLVSNTA